MGCCVSSSNLSSASVHSIQIRPIDPNKLKNKGSEKTSTSLHNSSNNPHATTQKEEFPANSASKPLIRASPSEEECNEIIENNFLSNVNKTREKTPASSSPHRSNRHRLSVDINHEENKSLDNEIHSAPATDSHVRYLHSTVPIANNSKRSDIHSTSPGTNIHRRASLSVQKPLQQVYRQKSNTQTINEFDNNAFVQSNSTTPHRANFLNASNPSSNRNSITSGDNKAHKYKSSFDFDVKVKLSLNQGTIGTNNTAAAAKLVSAATPSRKQHLSTPKNVPAINIGETASARNSPQLSSRSERLDSMQIYSFLQLTAFSTLLSEGQLRDLANYLELFSYRKGQIIYGEGAESDGLFIVKQGTVLIQADKATVDAGIKQSFTATQSVPQKSRWKLSFTPNKDKNRKAANSGQDNSTSGSPQSSTRNLTQSSASSINLATKSAGQFFGGEAFRNKSGLRFYSTYALSDSQLFLLSRANFEAFSALHPGLGPKINNFLGGHFEMRLAKSDFFSSFNPAFLQLFVNLCNHKQYLSGHTLYEMKESVNSNSALFFLDCGSVKLQQMQLITEEKNEITLESGELLGLDCLLLDIPRIARATVHSTAICLELQRKFLRQFLQLCPSLLLNISRLIDESHIALLELFANKCYEESFRDFCASELSMENWNFYCQANKFRKTTNHENIRLEAQRIFNHFIANNAKELININGVTRAKIMKCIKELDSVDNNVFQAAEREILLLMSTDTFSRYKTSQIFITTIKDVNSQLEFAVNNKKFRRGGDNQNKEGDKNKQKQRRASDTRAHSGDSGSSPSTSLKLDEEYTYTTAANKDSAENTVQVIGINNVFSATSPIKANSSIHKPYQHNKANSISNAAGSNTPSMKV
jgi:CRP-like cAMP-binding protein